MFRQSYRFDAKHTMRFFERKSHVSFYFYYATDFYLPDKVNFNYLILQMLYERLKHLSVDDLFELCRLYYENCRSEPYPKKKTLLKSDQSVLTYCKNLLHSYNDEPAVIESLTSYQYWYKNGKLHRHSGAAIISPNGLHEWYTNGIKIDTYDPAWIKPKVWTNKDVDLLMKQHPITYFRYYADIMAGITRGEIIYRSEDNGT